MARRSGLGKGLGALIPSDLSSQDPEAVLRQVPVSQIEANARQPRVFFDEEALASLTASVRQLGVLQPVLLRPLAADHFELIAGERRWRAAQRAGLPSIPALVRTVDDSGILEQALVENLHREDLNSLEEAAAYQQLIEDFGFTHDDVARRVGKSRSAISNSLRLFQLPPSIQRSVVDGRLSAGHARALLGTPDRAFQEELAQRAISEELTVRQVEAAVRDRFASSTEEATSPAPSPASPSRPSAKSPPAGSDRAPGLLELEELLSDRLSTRVTVSMGASRGRMVIEFADLADLERLYREMTEAAMSNSGEPQRGS